MLNFVFGCIFSREKVNNFFQAFKGINDPKNVISSIGIKSQTEQSQILALPQIIHEIPQISDSRFSHPS